MRRYFARISDLEVLKHAMSMNDIFKGMYLELVKKALEGSTTSFLPLTITSKVVERTATVFYMDAYDSTEEYERYSGYQQRINDLEQQVNRLKAERDVLQMDLDSLAPTSQVQEHIDTMQNLIEYLKNSYEWEPVPDGVYKVTEGTAITIVTRPDKGVDIAIQWADARLWSALPEGWQLMRSTKEKIENEQK